MIEISGYSDDIISVEGDLSDEFPSHGGDLVAVSDGTVLRVTFGEQGVWRITPVVKGPAFDRIEQAEEGAEDCYSDRAFLATPVWVVHASAIVRGGAA